MKRVFTLAFCMASCMITVAQPKTATKPAAKAVVPAAKAAAPKTTPAPALRSAKDSAGYALGIRIAQSLQAQGLESVNITLLQRALADVLQGKKLVMTEEAINPCIESYMDDVQAQKLAASKKLARVFHDSVGRKAGVATLPSGLQYEVLKAGNDTLRPGPTDRVKVHYHGTLIDGTVFDSSVERGEPIVLSVNGVISGWQEALQLMSVGSKWKLYLPADLAYGDHAPPGSPIGPGASLIFEVELISIEQN